jgi:hypothetical protein
MQLSNFLKQLYENGRVQVSILPDESASDLQDVEETLRSLNEVARAEFPGEAPDYEPSCAMWAALTFYRGCQFLVFREIGADVVQAALSTPCPLPASPSVCYSADLTLRYLPDLISLAKGISKEDPLVGGLHALATAWPLSSVGVATAVPSNIDAIASHPGLLSVYADRILLRKDHTRLNDNRAVFAVRKALGARRELCPEIFDAHQVNPGK